MLNGKYPQTEVDFEHTTLLANVLVKSTFWGR